MVARKRKTKKELEDQRREKKECLEALQSAQVARGETGAVQTAKYCEFMEKVVKASAAKQIQQVDAAKLTGEPRHDISTRRVFQTAWRPVALPSRTAKSTVPDLGGIGKDAASC